MRNKEEISKLKKELYFTRRNAYLQLHGPCKNCGSWENLEFHHRDPKDKVTEVNFALKESSRNIELSKCDILCRDCHTLAVPSKHGTAHYYHNLRCRCQECKKAHAKEVRDYLHRKVKSNA